MRLSVLATGGIIDPHYSRPKFNIDSNLLLKTREIDKSRKCGKKRWRNKNCFGKDNNICELILPYTEKNKIFLFCVCVLLSWLPETIGEAAIFFFPHSE